MQLTDRLPLITLYHFIQRLSIVVILIASSAATYAQWVNKNLGLYGGDIETLVSNGSVLFAGTYGNGIFRSTDRGLSWQSVSEQFKNTHIEHLYATTDKVYAATWGGVFVSSDNGDSWKDAGLVNKGIVGAVVPSGNLLYAAAGTILYRSDNEGATWVEIGDKLTSGFFTTLYAHEGIIYIGTNLGAYRIADNEDEWTPLTNLGSKLTYDFLVSGSTLYAATLSGVYSSQNGGDTWTALTSGLNNSVSAIGIIGSTLYAAGTHTGLYKSSNNGGTWVAASNGLTTNYLIDLAIIGPDIFVATVAAGVFHSVDAVQWTPVNYGLTNCSIEAITMKDSHIFAGTRHGLFRWNDQVERWDAMDNGLNFKSKNINTLLVNNNKLFAATSGGLFYFDENAGTWIEVELPKTEPIVVSIASTTGYIYAAISGDYVYRSSNNGGTWQKTGVGLPYPNFRTMAAFGNELFVATYDDGVFRSSDNGATWIELKNGGEHIDVVSLYSDGQNICTASLNGILHSADNGNTWMKAEGFYGTFPTNIVHDATGLGLYVADFNGLYRSEDNGASWTLVNDLITEPGYVMILNDKLYVGATGEFWVVPLAFTVGVEIPFAKNALSVFPNPATKRITVGLPATNGCLISYELISGTASVVASGSIETSDGQVGINIENISPGVYVLRTQGCQKTAWVRVVVY
jgi:photosystem II stability/assembly factor-like uncharacterized protein